MRTPREIEADMRMVCAGEYFRVGVTSATLDGDFSAEQLQRLATLMIEYREAMAAAPIEEPPQV